MTILTLFHGQLGYADEAAWVLGTILLVMVLVSTAVSHWQTHKPVPKLNKKANSTSA